MVKFEQLAVIVPLSVVLALVLIIIYNGMPTQSDEQKAAANTMSAQGNHAPVTHTRPICQDSTFFRANVNGAIRSCNWVAHNPGERCGTTLGTDNNGNSVYAKDACFDTCDTGNCRRRGLRPAGQTDSDSEITVQMELEELEQPLN
jgi:hypothetical protein